MKRFGTRISHQGFCTFCGWTGAHWFGEGSKGNAQAELDWHMKDSDQCAIQCMKRHSHDPLRQEAAP